MKDCGVSKYITVDEYNTLLPSLTPVSERPKDCPELHETRRKISKRLGIDDIEVLKSPLQVHAIFVLSNPESWIETNQLFCDLMSTPNGEIANKLPSKAPETHIPIYVANNEFNVKSLASPGPRFGAGAFMAAWKDIYSQLYKSGIDVNLYGKTDKNSLDYIGQLVKQEGGAEVSQFYYIRNAQNIVFDRNAKPSPGVVNIVIGDSNNTPIPGIEIAEHAKDTLEAVEIILKKENIM